MKFFGYETDRKSARNPAGTDGDTTVAVCISDGPKFSETGDDASTATVESFAGIDDAPDCELDAIVVDATADVRIAFWTG